ncbi:hypothetical protein [Oceanicoccus sp. KOV_DT_Chl]|uniref:hypothetical protein n=1 Tax=Oceanicoccus sp. KOV_DT_Chl TaxID=1904639 RepID=UPI000C7B4588|nr:hypothetical protein [Oceanicoccus sp. KOV_DT_Chl]
MKDETLKFLAYEAIVTVWLTGTGDFSKVDIDLIEGGEKVAAELDRFFQQLGGIGKSKPLEEENNRFRFRISSKI